MIECGPILIWATNTGKSNYLGNRKNSKIVLSKTVRLTLFALNIAVRNLDDKQRTAPHREEPSDLTHLQPQTISIASRRSQLKQAKTLSECDWSLWIFWILSTYYPLYFNLKFKISRRTGSAVFSGGKTACLWQVAIDQLKTKYF